MCYLDLKDFKNFSQVKKTSPIKNQRVFLTRSSAFLLFIFFSVLLEKVNYSSNCSVFYKNDIIKSFWNHFEKIQAYFIKILFRGQVETLIKPTIFSGTAYVHHEQV